VVLTLKALPNFCAFQSRLNCGGKCIKPKIDIHRSFVNPLLLNVYSSRLIRGLRIMLRSKAKADAMQSNFGDDAPVGVIS